MKSLKAEYEELIRGLDQYGATVCAIISEALHDSNIQIHSVNFRVKDFKSVSRKVSTRPGKYKNLKDLTDILGIRVITYFPHDVDKVANALDKELNVDRKNSVDKRKLLDSDKFGYLSLHYVVTLSESRNKLVEYRRFSKLRFEIQIRSILQHAWAEIEHDLGYKAEGSLPSEMRRSFSRLAGLLELADEEFERIRESLGAYEEHVSETIEKAPQTLMIDQSTVMAALKTENMLIKLDEAIARVDNSKLLSKFDVNYIGSQARQLKILGVRDINHLLRLAKYYAPYVEKFAEHWLKNETEEDKLDMQVSFSRGVGLFYLSYVLVAQLPKERVTEWNLPLQDTFPNIVSEVEETWKNVVKDLGLPPQEARKLLPHS